MAIEPVKMQDEVELEVGGKKLKIRGSDILGVAQLVLIALVAYGGWQHTVSAGDDNKNIVQAIREQVNVQREQLNAARETNCLNRLTPEQKMQPKEIEFCRDLGKGR